MPSAYDPVSAMLVERTGFPALNIGSYATAAAAFDGRDEMEAVARIGNWLKR